MSLLIDDDAGAGPGNTPEFSVSELSGAVKRMVEGEFGHVRVRGEVGRVSRPRSGHIYLDLKDDRSVLAGVIWKGVAGRLATQPEEGMEVIATGRLTTFPGQSKYQIVIEEIAPSNDRATASTHFAAITGSDLLSISLLLPSLVIALEQFEGELSEARPNSDEGRERIEALSKLALKIRGRLVEVERALESEEAEKDTGEVAIKLRESIVEWSKENKDDLVDLALRTPILAGAIGILNIAGANMVVGTAIAAALIGGPKVLSTIKDYLKE